MKLILLIATAAAIALAEPIAFPNGRDQQQGPPCNQCKPLPEDNKCDISTSCTPLGGAHTGPGPAPLYCACRAGYKADAAPGRDPNDPTVQYRLPWAGQEGRVFVSPGVPCNTLCNEWYLGKDGCKEVKLRQECM